VRCGIQPHVAAFALAELGAIGLGEQLRGDGVRLVAAHAADQFRSGGDVAPLIAASHLHGAIHVLVQPVEIVSLHQLVAELGEGEAGFQSASSRCPSPSCSSR
jgi:hypothetical protein